MFFLRPRKLAHLPTGNDVDRVGADDLAPVAAHPAVDVGVAHPLHLGPHHVPEKFTHCFVPPQKKNIKREEPTFPQALPFGLRLEFQLLVDLRDLLLSLLLNLGDPRLDRQIKDAYYSRRPPKGLIFHSDRGGQYRSLEFRSLLLGHNVRQSFSKPGVPFDNAPIESFFASLKVEEIYRFHCADIRDLTTSLRDYVPRRPHSNSGGKTPVEAEDEYY